MRRALLSTASAAALLAFAAPAALADSDFSGVAQAFVGTARTDGGFTDALDDPFIYGANGKGYWPLSPDVHLQADLFIEQDNDLVRDWGDHEHGDATKYGGAVHLLHPFENRARFGVAGSIWNTDVYVPEDDGRASSTYGLAALEAQIFGTDWTIMGQAGGFDAFDCTDNSSCPGAIAHGAYVRAKFRYFLHDNTVISLESTRMWGTLRDDGIFGGKSLTTDFEQWVLDAEHRFEDSQFAVAVALSHEHDDEIVSVDTDAVLLKLKFYYNQPTLRANDRSGAELDTPQFGNILERSGVIFEAGP